MKLLQRIILCGLLPVPVSTTAYAEGFPSKGDYKITYTGINTSPMKPMMIGDNQVTITGQAIMTAVNSEGKGFLHNLSGRCTLNVVINNADKTTSNKGFCDYVDADGDHLLESYEYPTQAMGPVLKGTGVWTGGTGKFQGLSGKIAITGSRLPTPVEGFGQNAGTKIGSYSIEQSSASASRISE